MGKIEKQQVNALVDALRRPRYEVIPLAGVEEVVDAHGDLGPFRTLQKQPAWQGRRLEEQLHRFMGSGGKRKIRYARYLVDALDLARMPRPLDRVLTHV